MGRGRRYGSRHRCRVRISGGSSTELAEIRDQGGTKVPVGKAHEGLKSDVLCTKYPSLSGGTQRAFAAVTHMSGSANRRALWARLSERKVPDDKETGSHDPIDDRAEGNIPARYFRIDKAVVQQIPEPVQSKSPKNDNRIAIHTKPCGGRKTSAVGSSIKML